MTKFTSDWEVDQVVDQTVCFIASGTRVVASSIQPDDARLIVQAPKMLALLEQVAEELTLECIEEISEVLQEVRGK